jgi:hypothetical protein
MPSPRNEGEETRHGGVHGNYRSSFPFVANIYISDKRIIYVINIVFTDIV